jgi:hypothetical protein
LARPGDAGQGRAARDYFRDLLITVEKKFGPDHPATLCARHDAALWAGEVGDNADARDQFAAVLSDRIAIFGADHIDTLQVRHNLTRWTGKAGDQLVPQTGRPHPDVWHGHPLTLNVRHNLARWTGHAGDPWPHAANSPPCCPTAPGSPAQTTRIRCTCDTTSHTGPEWPASASNWQP